VNPYRGVEPGKRMEKIIVMEDEFVVLWYHPKWKIVHHQFKKYPRSLSLREALSRGAGFLERRKACKWLSDDRKSSVLTDADLQWTETQWRPRAIKAGLRYWAIVPPATAIGTLNMNRLAREHRKLGVKVEFFDSAVAAMNWLKGELDTGSQRPPSSEATR
jgi:hypothetical protein